MNLLAHIASDVRLRLAVLNNSSPVGEAAQILANPTTPLVVICDGEGVAVGVVSRMDIVKLFSRAPDQASWSNAESIMTRSFLSFRDDQSLQLAWDELSSRGLRCAPMLDGSGRPVGVVHARDLVRALLNEVSSEELMLRDYVLGVGYR